MIFKVRRPWERVCEVIIEARDVRIDLGILDEQERRDFAQKLRDTADELMEGLEDDGRD